MCLIVTSDKPQIATRDIVCYKVCIEDFRYNTSVITPYRKVSLNIGVEYEDVNDIDIAMAISLVSYVVGRGVYHSFAHLKDARNDLREWLPDAIHSFCIVKCIIPKGSEYYIGMYHENNCPSYGSKKIKLIEKLCV